MKLSMTRKFTQVIQINIEIRFKIPAKYDKHI